MHVEQKLSGKGFLSLLIAKNFGCLEPEHHRNCDDDVDTFPHPKEALRRQQFSSSRI